jgi:hypothetical protein
MAKVTVIIVSEGEFDQLTKCLQALRFPEAELQVIVVAMKTELSETSFPQVSLLNFPDGVTRGSALNRALEIATGEWVHFLDEAVYWSKDYAEVLLPLLMEEHYHILGGPELPARDVSLPGHAMYLALSSPFCQGTGFSRYRMLGRKIISSDEEKLSSSNIWIRKKLLMDHPFPDDYNQSAITFVLQKLKQSGHQEWYHPRLFVLGSRSASFLPLRKRIFEQGLERSELLRDKVGGSIAYVLPALFVLFHFFVLLYPPVLWPVYKLYLMLIFVASVGLSFKARRPWLFPMVMFFHWFFIWEYGWGFLIERLRRKWTIISERL